MMWAAGPIGRFVDRHPRFRMPALSFLILIGVALVGEGLGLHIPKGYIYFAMAFSVGVEVLNMRVRRRRCNCAPRSRLAPGAETGHAVRSGRGGPALQRGGDPRVASVD
ncbi:MAG: hypothetical protein PVG98_11470, partial [Chromatiales bacterium]